MIATADHLGDHPGLRARTCASLMTMGTLIRCAVTASGIAYIRDRRA